MNKKGVFENIPNFVIVIILLLIILGLGLLMWKVVPGLLQNVFP